MTRIQENKILVLLLVVLAMTVFWACEPEQENIPEVNNAWAEWIKNNHFTIRNLEADNLDFSDLCFLENLLQNRPLVQLGESGHGVSEFNKAKVKMIKYMHQEMGYEVIAFESSIFECYMANKDAEKLAPEDIMGRSIFGVWHCEEVIELFKYIKDTHNTFHPLILAGFDVQISSLSGLSARPRVFREAISKIDNKYADEVFTLDTEFLDNIYNDEWLATNRESLKESYQKLYQWFEDHMDALIQLYQSSPLLPLILQRTAWSMIPYINELCTDGTASSNHRDKGMAENIKFLHEKIFPEKKIMIWAHNFHIQHDAGAVPRYTGIQNMGYWLARFFRDKLYTIGLYMNDGKAAYNQREVYEIFYPQDNSLEAVLYQTGKEFAFIDLLHQTPAAGNSWMFSSIQSREWGVIWCTIVPSDQYDGILYVKTVNPPDYVTYYGLDNWAPNQDPSQD